jgi:glutamine amidotransferase
MKIVIIDYNAGNVGSILNMLKRLGVNAELTNDHSKIMNANKLILPGVGHFDYGMKELKKTAVIPILTEAVLNQKTPILGICLGTQLFTEYSEEGEEKGLGWFKASTKRFRFGEGENKKLPHMGWADVCLEKKSKIFNNMYDNPRFYFVHTFHMLSENTEDVLMSAEYGYRFSAGLERDNIIGVQFHPEKSHKYGMKLLENFVNEY